MSALALLQLGHVVRSVGASFPFIALERGPHADGVAAIVRMGDDILGVTEHVLGLGNLLKTQAVNGLNIRNGGDLVALHDVQADPGYTSVGLVVNEQVFAVITTIRHGNVGVMGSNRTIRE